MATLTKFVIYTVGPQNTKSHPKNPTHTHTHTLTHTQRQLSKQTKQATNESKQYPDPLIVVVV